MSRRVRAVAFLVLAVGCAALAATIANGYGASVAESFGPLREVLVAKRDLAAGDPIEPADLSSSLQLRRVPARFVPPGALSIAEQALGREPATPLPAGSYVVAAQLRAPQDADAGGAGDLERGRRPVEIAVEGGEALLATGSPQGSTVDVVVTTEPNGPGPGHTYIAAAGVRLLALTQQDPAGPGPSAGWSATLALTRGEALRLIEAESFARGVRLLPRPAAP
jgi:Flp pilus assembly protein CpaB